MKAILSSLLLILIALTPTFSQNIEGWFEKQEPTHFEKLYLHTDREFYFEGDTLWFAAYLVNGQTHIPSETNCNLYIDIINKNGKIVQNHLFVIQKGLCAGNIDLDRKKIQEGNFILRAYTDYLKNFGHDAFFSKPIQVSTVKNSFNEITEDIKKPTKTDVQFLPEGGFILAEKSNCIAFKAIDENGKGIDITGKITDSSGNAILEFKSLYKGAGKFYFIPKQNERYTAHISGMKKEIKLPLVKNTGAKLSLINQNEQSIQLSIHASGGAEKANYQLAVLHRGKALFHSQIKAEQLNQIIRIETSKLRNGINRLVLLNEALNPVSERLVFQNKLKFTKLDVAIGDESYSTREDVQLNIMPSENIQNEVAVVSIAVVDENYFPASGNAENIASWLLLHSELKGIQESLSDYFNDEKRLNAQAKIDLLMCVNGWSNYTWNTIPPNNQELDYKPQLGFDFTGKLQHAVGKKSLDEGNVFFMIKGEQETQFLDLPLKNDGSFTFRNVVFYDSASVFAQGRNKRNKHTIKFDIKFPDIDPFVVTQNELYALNQKLQIPASVYRQHYLNEIKLNEYNPNRENILLDEIEVKRKSYTEKWMTGPERKSGGPYLLTPEKTAGTTDIIQYLQTKVVGVFPTRGGQGITMFPGAAAGLEAFDPEPIFWIDYSITLTVDEIRNYSIDMFETIELQSPPMSYFYRAPQGVILLSTKKGRSLDDKKAVLLGGAVKTMNGFTRTREFYTPKYTMQNYKSKVPDYRNTLFWNPRVIVAGEKEIYFPACDNISRYKVIVEGLTETGKVCMGEASFEVNSISK